MAQGKRSFVDKLDFVTSLGHGDGPGSRETARRHDQGADAGHHRPVPDGAGCRDQRADRRRHASRRDARADRRCHRLGAEVRGQGRRDARRRPAQELSVLRELHARTKAAIQRSVSHVIEARQAGSCRRVRRRDRTPCKMRKRNTMDDTYSRAGDAADPPSLSPDYVGTRIRSPSQPLIIIPQTLSEITGPVYGHSDVKPEEADLTKQHAGEPLGERIIVKGRVLDEDGRPVPNYAGRDLAVQRRRPLHPRGRPASRAARSQLHRRRPRRHRRRRATTSSPPSSPAPIPGATTTTPGARRTSTCRCSGRRS